MITCWVVHVPPRPSAAKSGPATLYRAVWFKIASISVKLFQFNSAINLWLHQFIRNVVVIQKWKCHDNSYESCIFYTTVWCVFVNWFFSSYKTPHSSKMYIGNCCVVCYVDVNLRVTLSFSTYTRTFLYILHVCILFIDIPFTQLYGSFVISENKTVLSNFWI